MPDTFGGIDLPVALSGATLDDVALGKADPTAHKLLAFCVAVMRAQAGTEWSALRPRPAGDTEGTNVVRRSFVQNPEEGQFSTDDLPALFLWRTRGRQEDTYADFRTETSTFSLLWVLPVDQPNKEALRKPFVNAAMKAVGSAISQGRHPAWFDADDEDPKAPTREEDDDAVVLAFATSTSPMSFSGAGLDGVVGGAVMVPRRGLAFETTAAAGAYNIDDPIEVTYLDWRDNERTSSLFLTDEDGGEIVSSIFEAKQILSIALPAQSLASGEIRIGLQAYDGLGSVLLDRIAMMKVEMTEWAPAPLQIPVYASDGSVERTLRYYGALGTIVGVEQHIEDVASRAWPLDEAPAGIDFDVDLPGYEAASSSSLPHD